MKYDILLIAKTEGLYLPFKINAAKFVFRYHFYENFRSLEVCARVLHYHLFNSKQKCYHEDFVSDKYVTRYLRSVSI